MATEFRIELACRATKIGVSGVEKSVSHGKPKIRPDAIAEARADLIGKNRVIIVSESDAFEVHRDGTDPNTDVRYELAVGVSALEIMVQVRHVRG